MRKHYNELPHTYSEFIELIKKNPKNPHAKEYVKHLNQLHHENKITPSIYQFVLTPRGGHLIDDDQLLISMKYFFQSGFEIHRHKGLILILAASHPKIFDFFTTTMQLRPTDQEHPLLLCKKAKNPDLFETLVRRISDYSGQEDTVFTYAARANHLELMQSIFEETPDPERLNTPDKTGMTPWHHAILEGNREILAYLESRGIDQEARTHQGEHMAHLLFKSKNKSFIQEVLESNQYNIRQRLSEVIPPYHRAPIVNLIKFGEVSWLAAWLESTTERPRDLARIAVSSNRIDMLMLLHENYGYPVEHLLADCSSIEIAQWLKERGASFFSPSVQDEHEEGHDRCDVPNIMRAISDKSEPMIEWYLQAYPWDFKVYLGERSRFSILTYLMEHNHFNLIKKYDLLKDKSLFFCERSFMGEIEHYVESIPQIYPEIASEFYDFLIYLQASLTKHFSSKYPVYGFSGSPQILLTMSLEIGLIGINDYVNDGITDGTPAWMTCENRIYFESLRKRANFDSFHGVTSKRPIKSNITEEQKLYFSDPYTRDMQDFFKTHSINVNQRDRKNKTILSRLIKYGAEARDRIEWFVEHTAIDINHLDEKGSTLLHLAAQEGVIEIVRWIIDYKHPKTRKTLLQSGRINFQATQDTPERYNALDLALIHQHDAIAELLWIGMTDATKKSYLNSKLKQDHRHVLTMLQTNDCYGWNPNEKFQEKLSRSLKSWLICAGKISAPLPEPAASEEDIKIEDFTTIEPQQPLLPTVHEITTPTVPVSEPNPVTYTEILNVIRTDNLYRFKNIKRQSIEHPEIAEQLQKIPSSEKFELFAVTLDVGSYRILNQMFRIKAFEEFVTQINPGTNYIETLMSYIIKRSNYKALCIFLKYDSFRDLLSRRPDTLYTLIRLALDLGNKSIIFPLLSHQAFQSILPEIVALDDNYLFRKASSLGYLDLMTYLAQFEIVKTHADAYDNAALRQVGWRLDEESCCFLLSLPSVSHTIRKDDYAFMSRLDPVTDSFLISILHRVPEIVEFFHLNQYILTPIYPIIYVQFIPYSIQSFNIESLEKEIMFAIVNGQLTVLANFLQHYTGIRPEMLKNMSKLALMTHQLPVLRWLIEQDYQETLKQDPDFCFELLSYALYNQFSFEESQYLLDIYLMNGMQKHHESLIKVMIRQQTVELIESLFSKNFDCTCLSQPTKIQLGKFLLEQGLESRLTWLIESDPEHQEQLRLLMLDEKTRPVAVSLSDSRDSFFQKADSKASSKESAVSIKRDHIPS